MNLIKLQRRPVPRMKETSQISGVSEDCIKYPYLLSVNMQDDIRDSINIKIKEDSVSSLPISGTVSLFIDIYTNEDLLLTGILKNILDPLNGLLYTDDRNVASLLIRRLPEKSDHNEIKIGAIVTRPIASIDDSIEDYSNYVSFTTELETVLESHYLPYLIQNGKIGTNNYYDDTHNDIRRHVASEYQGSIFSSPLSISIETTSDCVDGDIDNIALSYIPNLEGILFVDETQVDTIFLRRNVDSSRVPSVEITWK